MQSFLAQSVANGFGSDAEALQSEGYVASDSSLVQSPSSFERFSNAMLPDWVLKSAWYTSLGKDDVYGDSIRLIMSAMVATLSKTKAWRTLDAHEPPLLDTHCAEDVTSFLRQWGTPEPCVEAW